MRNKNKKYKFGIIIFALVFTFYLIIVFRLLHIQVFADNKITKKANNNYQQVKEKELTTNKLFQPLRGNIYTRNGNLLATTIYKYRVFLDGLRINNCEWENILINNIVNIFDVNKKTIVKAVESNDRFIPITRREEKEKIFRFFKEVASDTEYFKNGIDFSNDKNIKDNLYKLQVLGVYCKKDDPKRIYPMGELASHIVGYINHANQGIGIEGGFNEFLTGKKSEELDEIPHDGGDIYLTIDENIQYFSENAIKWGYDKYKPESISVVVLSPDTGEVLSMANYPTFNPNYYNKINNRKKLLNRAIAHSFEPGSTFKLITLSAGFEENIINRNMVIDCNGGVIDYKGETIRDSLNNGELTLSEVFERSSNVGTIKIADMIGKEKLYYYTKQFGFTEDKTIELANESNAYLRPLSKWVPSDLANFSIGYGMATNLLRLTNAYAAVANGGKLYQNYVISKFKKTDNTYDVSPLKIRRVIDKKNVKKVKNILQNVVEDGSAKRTKIEGVNIAGKTGTAIIFNRKENKYDSNNYIGTFIGFLPVKNPKYVVGVMVNQPEYRGYASKFAVPVFKKIAMNLVRYGGI